MKLAGDRGEWHDKEEGYLYSAVGGYGMDDGDDDFLLHIRI